MPLPFVTHDVFTDTRFAGNPLAVVFRADTLTMLARDITIPLAGLLSRQTPVRLCDVTT